MRIEMSLSPAVALLLQGTCLLLGPAGAALGQTPIPAGTAAEGGTVASRLVPPEGFERVAVPEGGFGAWLRNLPLHPGRPPVHLFDGREKRNQAAQYAVLRVDVGSRDLQQCADAVMRLRAEHLLAAGCEDSIAFRFTSGDLASWKAWREGSRPRVSGNRVEWRLDGEPDSSYRSFRRYLDTVFTYAGSASLEKELLPVADPVRPQVGDVYIQGGFPGHAVIVLDVAENPAGERVFALAQSYMPAQEIHVLVNPAAPGRSPWYPARASGLLRTPEWRFHYENLHRFPGGEPCPGPPRASPTEIGCNP